MVLEVGGAYRHAPPTVAPCVMPVGWPAGDASSQGRLMAARRSLMWRQVRSPV